MLLAPPPPYFLLSLTSATPVILTRDYAILPAPRLERGKKPLVAHSLSYPAKIADWWVKTPIREKQTIVTVFDRNHRASEHVGGKEACTRMGQFRKGRLAAFKSSKFRSELLRVWGTPLTKSS